MGGLLRVLRWIGTGAAVVAIVAGLIVGSAYALLQSEAGRARVVEILNQQLSTPGGMQVRIGRLDGDLPSRIVIHEVSLSDGRDNNCRHEERGTRPVGLVRTGDLATGI